MKVLLVNGSPHKNGCTFTALKEIEKTLNSEGIDAEIFWIGNKPISGCIACLACSSGAGKCVCGEDVNIFREKAKESDGFIFGSPVHYASISGALSSFMDRLFYSDSGAYGGETFRLKPAAGIISARRGGTTASFDRINKYFTINEMPVISSRYWNMVHGTNPEEVLQDKEGLFTMRVLAKNMAYHLKCKEAALKAGITPPEKEEPVRTNFIR